MYPLPLQTGNWPHLPAVASAWPALASAPQPFAHLRGVEKGWHTCQGLPTDLSKRFMHFHSWKQNETDLHPIKPSALWG